MAKMIHTHTKTRPKRTCLLLRLILDIRLLFLFPFLWLPAAILFSHTPLLYTIRYGTTIVAIIAIITTMITIAMILLVFLLLKFIRLPSFHIFLYILYSLQYFCKKHSSHLGLRAVHIVRPNVMICILYRIQWSFGSSFIRSCSIFSGSWFFVRPSRFDILFTWVSTTTLGSW